MLCRLCLGPVVLPSFSWRQPTMRPHCIGEGILPALRALCGCCADPLWWSFCLGAGVPNSMGSYTQGGRYVSGLALAPFLASGCRVACVGPIAVTRFLVTAWARAEGRVIQGYLRVPPGARFSVLPLLGSGQSAVYPGVPSGAAWCRCSVRPWRVEEEEGTRTVVGIGHPQLRAFLVLAPGLR